MDSNGNPHVAFSHWDYTHDEFGRTTTVSHLNYAAWTGNSWDIQTVDSSASYGGMLKLDSGNRPHIIYTSGNDRVSLKYAVLSGGAWSTQTIDSSERWIEYAMALDLAGSPHVVYTSYHYSENYSNDTSTHDIKYATFNGRSWSIQIIDRLNSSVGFNTLSIALDSKGNHHVTYLEDAEFSYPRQNGVGFNPLDTYNIKYAFLSGSTWQSQTVFTNSTNIGNLILNSEGQPSFSYEHDIFTVHIEYGSYGVNRTINYGYWDGHNWISQPVYSSRLDWEKTFLHIDSNKNPQVYFYASDYSHSNNSGLMYAQWTGSNWNINELENILKNSTFEADRVEIVDMAFDSQGNPAFTVDGPVGNIRGMDITGDLTYTCVGALPVSSFGNNRTAVIPVVFAILALAFLSVILERKKNPPRN